LGFVRDRERFCKEEGGGAISKAFIIALQLQHRGSNTKRVSPRALARAVPSEHLWRVKSGWSTLTTGGRGRGAACLQGRVIGQSKNRASLATQSLRAGREKRGVEFCSSVNGLEIGAKKEHQDAKSPARPRS